MSTAQSGSAISPFHRYPFIIGNIRIPLFFRFTQNPNKLTVTADKEYQQTKTIGGYVFEHWGRKPMTMHVEVTIKKDSSLGNYLGFNTSTTDFGIEDSIYSPELQTLQTLFNIDQRRIKSFPFGDGKVDSILNGVVTAAAAGAAIASNPVMATTAVVSGVAGALEKNAKYKEPTQSSIQGYASTITDTILLYKGVIYSGFFTKLYFEEEGRSPFSNKVSFDFLITNTTQDWVDTSLTQTAAGRVLGTLYGATTSLTTVASMFDGILTDSGSNTNGHV